MTFLEKLSEKINEKIVSRILLVCCFLLAGLMVARCFWGIEITDEAYYVADAINALHGNYPFAYNFSNATGMNLITVPLVALYELFVPDLEGVFLFMRISFTLFRLCVLTLAYVLLKRRHKKCVVLFALLFLLPYYGAQINNWSYNTIPGWLILMVGILLGTSLEEGAPGRICICAAISGVLMSYAELAHPLNFLNVLFFGGVILLFAPRGAKGKALALYAAGGIVNTAAVFGLLAAKAGIRPLLYGLNVFLTGGGKSFGKAMGNANRVKWAEAWHFFNSVWFFMAAAVIGYVLLYLLYRIVRKKPVDVKYGAQMAVALLTLCSAVGTIMFMGVQITNTDMHLFGASVIIPFAIFFLGHIKRPLAWLMAVPEFLFCFTEIWMTKTSSALGRFYYLIPVFFVMFLLLLESSYQTVRAVTVAACILGVCLLTGFDYLFVYRDVPISEMDYRMPSGIYKGIYTEAQNGRDTLQLEAYLHEITEEDEWIKFCDNVPVGYLFQDGKMCDLKAWDALNYTYRRSSANKLYKYFINRGAIPDKLIYVDFKRDEQLSIEDESWHFNEFVNLFYEFEEENILNGTYRIKIYLRKGAYEDYLKWREAS